MDTYLMQRIYQLWAMGLLQHVLRAWRIVQPNII